MLLFTCLPVEYDGRDLFWESVSIRFGLPGIDFGGDAARKLDRLLGACNFDVALRKVARTYASSERSFACKHFAAKIDLACFVITKPHHSALLLGNRHS